MKKTWLLLAFIVTWEVFFTTGNYFVVYRRSQEFETRKEMVGFIESMPKDSFECVPPEYPEGGRCEIRNMKPRLAK